MPMSPNKYSKILPYNLVKALAPCGENIYKFMNTYYSGANAHEKAIVQGIGHDGEGRYKSPEFMSLLKNLL